MADSLPIFGFIRLRAQGTCRASLWQSDATEKCWTSSEWLDLIQKSKSGFSLESLRARIEFMRLLISERLGQDGIDRWGALRSLLISERVSSTVESWLRDGGWVHVLVASGMHLLVLQSLIEHLMLKLGQILRWNAIGVTRAIQILKWSAFVLFWALSGFRAGLLRVILVQLLRDGFRRDGRWVSGPKLLAISCGADAVLALLFALGNPTDVSDFGAGRLHYGLAIYGGYFGYELARAKKFGTLRTHFNLALYSWLATALLDLMVDHKISLLIPIYSLVSIPLLTGIVFPLSVICSLGVVLGSGFLAEGIDWISVFWNLFLEWGAVLSYEFGLFREVKTLELCCALIVALVFWICRTYFLRKTPEKWVLSGS